ncbi:hypothetical protein OUZ56_032088 [Daphnia magna]|uniref:Uncharacterized protein n=1 Tax=Daphnia magna TaxID=35525 RepID=A0ABQ9ZW45_9CRUS|nr:hypothetical protein OUZ56_032088 [Daphnia magna]
MENHLNLNLSHLFNKVRNNHDQIFQTWASKLPSLILAIKSLKESEVDFQSNDPKVQTQIIRLIQDIRLTNLYQDDQNPSTVWKEPTTLLKYLTSILETQRGSILPSFARSGRPIHSLEDGIAGLSRNIFGEHSQPYPIPTRAATTDSTGTTDARDQLTAEEVGQFPRSQQTEQRTAHRGDQTNALPNQNPIEATAITGYQRTDIAAIRVTIASTAAVENNSTTDTSTIHRPPPYSATPQSAYKSTQPFPGTTVQVDSRRCCEP